MVQFEAGEVLLEQGSQMHRGLFLIESGSVRIYDVDRHRLIQRCGPGDLFGVFGLIKGGLLPYEAKAVTATTCAILPPPAFQALYKAHPVLALYFDRDVQQFVQRMDHHIDVGGAHLLFSRRLGDLPLRPMLVGPPETTVQDATHQMTVQRYDAFAVQDRDGLVQGLVTDRSLRRTILAQGRSAETPIAEAIQGPVASLPPSATLFDALLAMLEFGTEHVLIQNEEDSPHIRCLSASEVAHFRGKDPLATLRHIDHGADLETLASMRAETHEMLQSFYEQRTPPESLALLTSTIYDRIVRRALYLVERQLRQERPQEAVGLSWCWLRLGSTGRQEAGVRTQQHNGLVYASPSGPDEARRAAVWFQRLAARVCEALERCGFPLSPLVAQDASYCKPVKGWRTQLQQGLNGTSETPLADVLLMLDVRPLQGDLRLADELQLTIRDTLHHAAGTGPHPFLRRAAAHLDRQRPPTGFLDRLRQLRPESTVEVNVYVRGLVPALEGARLLALELGYLDRTSTYARLRRATAAFPDLRATLRGVAIAYEHLYEVRLQHQLNLAEGGDQLTEEVSVNRMTRLERQAFQRALRTTSAFHDLIVQRYA
ncbi:MAG: DUF294 nucleotidyltransferase-like domain-containing protein [Bacteroidota bacterium]